MTALPTPSGPTPLTDADSEHFWHAIHEGHLALCHCPECGLWMQPPLERCRRCGGPTRFDRISGSGTLYTWTIVRRQAAVRYAVPYVVGVVELDEQQGLRLSGIVDDSDVPALGATKVRAGVSTTDGFSRITITVLGDGERGPL